MTAVELTSTLIVPVVIDQWQMECCGHPPGEGDVVSWRLRWHPDEAALLPTGLDLEADVERWDPGEDDPGFGAATPLRAGSARVPVLATYGPLRVFATSTDRVPSHLELRGVLHEDHHVDTPLNLPSTTGTVRSVYLLSFDHDRVPGKDSRRWDIVPGTGRLERVARSPKCLTHEEPAAGQTKGWRPGPTMILVDLDVTTT